MPEKVCIVCEKSWPIEDFRQRSAPNTHLRYNTCRECELTGNKAWRQKTGRDRRKVLWQYNMTPDQYDRMFAGQDGVCKICFQPSAEGKSLHIDHDHACCPTRPTCGKCTRGLLCDACNMGLGQFRDSPELLTAAASYLRGGD